MSFQYPDGVMNYPVSLESIIAIPSENFDTPEDISKYLMPEMTDRSGDYATECAKDYLQINPSDAGK